MYQKTSFFLFFLVILISIPSAYAGTTIATAEMLPEGQVVIEDEIVLDSNETLDVSDNVQPIPTQNQTIGGKVVTVKEGYKFNTSKGEDVIIENTDLPIAQVTIPDRTIVKAPTEWDGEITPPKLIASSGFVEGNFATPTSSIQVGSPDVVLVFDNPVTLILSGVSGTVAYKLPNETVWNIIQGCTGTFENPDPPTEPNECSISDGVDTKILTYHFTEFTALSSSTSTTAGGTTGGSGNTGVGSPRIFGPGSSGSGYFAPTQPSQIEFPAWFENVKDWYREGKISATEFLNAYDWIIKNIIK